MGTKKGIFIYDPVSDRAWVIGHFTTEEEANCVDAIWNFAEQAKPTYQDYCSIYVDKFRK